MQAAFIFILFLLAFVLFYSFCLAKRICRRHGISIRKHWLKILLIFSALVALIMMVGLFKIVGLFFLYFIFLSMTIDLINFALRPIIKNQKVKRILISSIIPLSLSFLIMLYGFFNISNIVKTDYTLYTSKNIDSLKVLYIADTHYGDVFKKDELLKVKKDLDKVDADIVLLGGDIVDEGTGKADMEYVFSVLGDIKNKEGVYFVYGNHDRQQYMKNRSYSEEELSDAIENSGITILEDGYARLYENLVIVGRDDYSKKRASVAELTADLKPTDYVIMLDHHPVCYSENREENVDLIMSGHTHKGQLFPIELFIKLFDTADLSYGCERYGDMDAIVTSGLVGWGYPIRTAGHSEYVVVEIKNE